MIMQLHNILVLPCIITTDYGIYVCNRTCNYNIVYVVTNILLTATVRFMHKTCCVFVKIVVTRVVKRSFKATFYQ